MHEKDEKKAKKNVFHNSMTLYEIKTRIIFAKFFKIILPIVFLILLFLVSKEYNNYLIFLSPLAVVFNWFPKLLRLIEKRIYLRNENKINDELCINNVFGKTIYEFEAFEYGYNINVLEEEKKNIIYSYDNSGYKQLEFKQVIIEIILLFLASCAVLFGKIVLFVLIEVGFAAILIGGFIYAISQYGGTSSTIQTTTYSSDNYNSSTSKSCGEDNYNRNLYEKYNNKYAIYLEMNSFPNYHGYYIRDGWGDVYLTENIEEAAIYFSEIQAYNEAKRIAERYAQYDNYIIKRIDVEL